VKRRDSLKDLDGDGKTIYVKEIRQWQAVLITKMNPSDAIKCTECFGYSDLKNPTTL
jgi:hypothetical protein